jgi:hypothetical protein
MMRLRGFSGIFILLLSAVVFCAAAAEQETLILKPGQSVYPLRQQLLVVDSLSGAGEYSYLIDVLYGRLILTDVPKKADTLRIYYRYSTTEAPQKLQLGIGRIDEWFPEEDQQIRTSGISSMTDVQTRGSVSRKIEVGSTGQNLLSGGLDLRIKGELSPGVFINGIISDNDAPFQDYASTQSVQDVDNILIRVYSDSLNAEIGDIYVRKDWNYWNRYQRKLIGAQADYRSSQYEGSAFLGSARGLFRRQEITPRNADQGPYRLMSGDGSEAITIVPESERIYVDGVALEKSQYTLYYSDAELFFSSDIMISSSSRIVAEFNYVNEFYPRSSLGAMSAWRFNKHMRLQASWIREKDDQRNPSDVHLANLPADSLAEIVPEEGYFMISTAMKDSSGDYVRESGIWVYAGEKAGDHSVYFYRENQNGGYVRRYDNRGRMYYSYAPEDPLSQYFPRRKVSLPSTRWIAAANLELGQQGKAHAVMEGALSTNNPNNYNRDTQNSAFSLKWDAGVPLGKVLVLKSTGWLKNPEFHAFGNLNEPDFERYLGFRAGDSVNSFVSAHAHFPQKALNSRIGMEYAAGNGTDQRMRLIAAGNPRFKNAELDYQWSQLLADTFLPHYNSRAMLRIPAGKRLGFQAEWQQDYFKPVFRAVSPYRNEKAGLAINWKEWQLGYTLRNDYDWHAADTVFQRYSRKHDLGLKLSESFFDNKISWSGNASYRYDQRESGDEHYILSGTQLSFRFSKIRLNGNLKANINRSSETKREAVFIYVGEGLGYYRLDDYGQYVPDDMGEFMMRHELTNERQDQYVSKIGSSLNWKRDFKTFRFEFAHNSNTDFRTPQLTFYIPFNIVDPDTNMIFGNLRLKHEANLLNLDGSHRFSLLFEDRYYQNFQTAYNEQISVHKERWLRYRYKPEKLILDTYYKYSTREQQRMPLGSYKVSTISHALGTDAEYLYSRSLRVSAGIKYEWVNTDFYDEFNTNWFQINGKWTWYRVAGERVFFSGTLDGVFSDYEGSLPYETANGLPAGWSWSGALRYEKRITQFVSASGFVQFRKRAVQKSVFSANIEVKAYF